MLEHPFADDGAMAADTILATDRLIVRRFVIADTAPFHVYRNLAPVAEHQGWETPYSLDEAHALVADMTNNDPFGLGEWTQLAIAYAGSPTELIGDIAVRMESDEPTAEIGFSLHPDHWGLGLVTEALDAIVEHLFAKLALARVVAFTAPENRRAQRTLERVGLRYIATDGNDLVYYRRND